MKKEYIILLASILFQVNILFAQEFVPPSEGNAVVYIVRTASFGSAHTFRFFHNESFVGVFKGKGYMRYEMPEGKQLLWASSENKRFLDCNFKSGGIYLISAKHKPGVVKNHVVLTPVNVEDSNFKKCKNVVLKNKEITTSDNKKAEIGETLVENDFINTVLKQYEEENKFENQTKDITPDMAIPMDRL